MKQFFQDFKEKPFVFLSGLAAGAIAVWFIAQQLHKYQIDGANYKVQKIQEELDETKEILKNKPANNEIEQLKQNYLEIEKEKNQASDLIKTLETQLTKVNKELKNLKIKNEDLKKQESDNGEKKQLLMDKQELISKLYNAKKKITELEGNLTAKIKEILTLNENHSNCSKLILKKNEVIEDLKTQIESIASEKEQKLKINTDSIELNPGDVSEVLVISGGPVKKAVSSNSKRVIVSLSTDGDAARIEAMNYGKADVTFTNSAGDFFVISVLVTKGYIISN